MGLNQEAHEKKTFLNVVNGKLAKRVPEGTDNAIEREIEHENVKRKIWELHYSDLEARITGVEIKEGDKFGDTLHIDCEDGGENFTISLSLQSREAKGFMNCLPNIDLSKKVKLEPYNYERKADGKKMMGMGVKQDGNKENVPFYYNKENGMPQASEDKIDKDEFKILMEQQKIFLKKQTKKFIAEKMVKGSAGTGMKNNADFDKQKSTEKYTATPVPDDDLPF